MNTEWTIFLMMFASLGTALICAIGFKLDAKEEMKELIAENKALREEITRMQDTYESRL